MKKARLLALALSAALSLSACGAAPEVEATPEPTPSPSAAPAETLDFVLPCYPSGGFHPITGANRTNLTLSPLLYRGLYALDNSFEARSDLCASAAVDDSGLIWTFTLNAATFSDDTAMTAGDVAYSLNLARKSDRYASRLAGLKSVSAGEGTVTVTLTAPNGALPTLLDVPVIRETTDALRPLGTGCYYLTGEGDALRLTARAGASVPLQEIPLRAIRASDDLVYAFDAREISRVDVDLTGANALGYSSRFETADYPTTGMLYLGLNTRTGACRDLQTRQALQYAFDRDNVANKLLAGHAAASALPVHPNAAAYSPELAQSLTFDGQRAADGLTAAGWTAAEDGKRHKGRTALSLTLLVNQDNTYKVTVAEALAASLETLGCTVTVQKLPWEDYTKALAAGKFDLYLAESLLTADFDLEALLGFAGVLNYGGYVDAQTTQLMAECRAASGEARKTAAAALYARIGETAPIIPLCFKNGSLLTQWGQVSGAEPTQRDVFSGFERWQIKM